MATKPMDEYNVLLMLNRELESVVKQIAIDDIVKHQLKEFEEKIRPIVKSEVEKISFQTIDKLPDMMSFRNELRLYVKWSDDDKAHMLEKERNVVRIEETTKTTEVDI